MLYGLDSARDAITKSRRAIVVEGYTDCLAARQAGIDDVVAVLGTALGERHAKLLRRYADRIVLVLDGDDGARRLVSRYPAHGEEVDDPGVLVDGDVSGTPGVVAAG